MPSPTTATHGSDAHADHDKKEQPAGAAPSNATSAASLAAPPPAPMACSPGVQGVEDGGRRSPLDIALCDPALSYPVASASHQMLDTARFQTGAADITPAVGSMPPHSPNPGPAHPSYSGKGALNSMSVPDDY